SFLIKRARQALDFRLDGFDGGVFAGHNEPTGHADVCNVLGHHNTIIRGKKARAVFWRSGIFQWTSETQRSDKMTTPKIETDPLTGAEAAVEMLRAHGVELLFGLCGDT